MKDGVVSPTLLFFLSTPPQKKLEKAKNEMEDSVVSPTLSFYLNATTKRAEENQERDGGQCGGDGVRLHRCRRAQEVDVLRQGRPRPNAPRRV